MSRARLNPIWLVFLSVWVVGSVQAQSTTWTGGTNTDWFTASNWSNGVPTINHAVTFQWGSTHSPIITGPAVARSVTNGGNRTITIQNGASLTVTQNVSVQFNNTLTNNGTLSIGGNFSISTADTLRNNGKLVVGGTLDVSNGSFKNGADSITVTNFISTNAKDFKLGTGVMTILNQTSDYGGRLRIEQGTLNIMSDFEVAGSANIDVGTGTINAYGDFTLAGGSTFNLSQGTFRIYGTSTFTGGGVFNAGTGNIVFDGDITFSGGSDFNAEQSTVTMTGEVTITVNNNNNAGNVEFFNLVVEEGASVTADADIYVYNDMTVGDEGFYENINETTLNVVGQVIGEPQIDAIRPYLIEIQILSPTSVRLRFNVALLPGTGTNGASRTANYDVENQSETVVSATQVDTNLVDLVFSNFTIQEAQEYFLHVYNLRTAANDNAQGQISSPHRKKFGIPVPPTFYSRQNGSWNSATSWSTESHTGSAATRAPGQSGDIVQIGNGHTIQVSTAVSAAVLAGLTVDASGSLTVASTGTFTLGTTVVNGSGTFTVETGGTLSIGSPDGIAASGAIGNVRTATRVFSTGGLYRYTGGSAQVTGSGLPNQVAGLRIENAAGVSLTASTTVTGTLQLTTGILSLESDIEVAAASVIYGTGSLRSRRELTGPAGWRLLGVPLRTTVADAFDAVVTQGFAGATYPARQPNVLHWDETWPGTDNQRWRNQGAATDTLVAGRGYYTYVFGDINGDPDYTTPFPIVLDAAGREAGTGPFSWPVTYTAAADSGWNLIANPFAATLDWDHPGWTKTGLDNVIYVWDPTSNGGNGSYLEWNGTTGTLGNGLIKPWQAFWVKANTADPVLQAPVAAKTQGGTFHRHSMGDRVDGTRIELTARMGEFSSTAFVTFGKTGSRFADRADAYRLQPLSSRWLDLHSIGHGGVPLAIQHLPAEFGAPIQIDFDLRGVDGTRWMTGPVELHMNGVSDLPDDWSVELIDMRNGRTLSVLDEGVPIVVNLTAPAGKARPDAQETGWAPGAVRMRAAAAGTQPRFRLHITPGYTGGLPDRFALEAPYPNPFNPSTHIPVALPFESRVRVEVFDLTGRRLAVLADGVYPAGRHELMLDAHTWASGVYLVRMVSDGMVETRKITLLR